MEWRRGSGGRAVGKKGGVEEGVWRKGRRRGGMGGRKRGERRGGGKI